MTTDTNIDQHDAQETLQQQSNSTDEVQTAQGPLMCKYWSSGRCKFGDQCKFTHDMSIVPPSYNTQHNYVPSYYPLYIPQEVQMMEHMVDPSSMVQQEVPYTRSTMMVTPCKFFYKGKCKYGLNCRFSHISHMQPYPYGYPFYSGYGSYYQPPNMFRTQEEIALDSEQPQENEQNNNSISTDDIENLTQNLKKALLKYNESTSNKSFDEVAGVIQDLTLSFVNSVQNKEQSNKSVVSYIKKLVPSLSGDDLVQIENICNKNKSNSPDRNSEDVSKSKKKKKTNSNNNQTVTTPTVGKARAGAPSAAPSITDHDITQYAPNSYAAALLKPRTEKSSSS